MTKEERDKEIVDWYPLVDLVVNKFLKVHGYTQLRQHRDDLVGVATEGLIKGIETYDPEQGTSKSTWYSLKMRTDILNHIRDFEGYGCTVRDISIDDLIKSETGEMDYLSYTSNFEEEEEETDTGLVEELEPEGEIDREIYHRILMGSNTTYQEIADEFGITRRGVVRRKQRLVKRLKKQLEDRNAN